MNNIQKTNRHELFDNIKIMLAEARKSVVRNINRTMVHTYFEIGRMIVEDEQKGNSKADYGERIIQYLSEKLTKEFGRGFSKRNLEQMRQFYNTYSISRTVSGQFTPIAQTLSAQSMELQDKYSGAYTAENKSFPACNFVLSWSHYLKLMRIDDVAERNFYEIEAMNNNWSLRELHRQCDSALFQRLVLSKDRQGVLELSRKGQIVEKPEDAIKDPLILEFTGLPENSRYSENDLEQKLIDKLEHFMLELGKGFTFVGRQVRFTFDEQHFRVDLVFYNRLLQCFVLIDLKIGKLTHQDLGQMQMYVNYYDRFVRLEHENRTIGIILCRDKSDTLVKITLPEDNRHIYASRYKTVLPSREELKKLIENKK